MSRNLLFKSGRTASLLQRSHCRGHPLRPHNAVLRRHLLTSSLVVTSSASAAVASQQRPALVYGERQLQSAYYEAWEGNVGVPRSHRDPPTLVTAPHRVIAIGDLHGDWDKTVRSLVLAGVLSVNKRTYTWVGGDTVVVQLGDVLDRGTSEIAIILLLRELDRQARKEGGAVYMLNGNHESLNVCLNYSYVEPMALAETIAYCELLQESEDVAIEDLRAHTCNKICEVDPYDRALMKHQFTHYRSALFQPGGYLAKDLAMNPTVLIVNDTVFAHGGVLPLHVNYGLEKLNAEVAAWMRKDGSPELGFAAPPFLAMGGSNSVMWTRMMSQQLSAPQKYHASSLLSTALARLDAKRLVVGHTPQSVGINSDMEDKVWRVDVGMSSGVLDAAVQVLEIMPQGHGDEVDISVLMEGMGLCSWDEVGVEVDI